MPTTVHTKSLPVPPSAVAGGKWTNVGSDLSSLVNLGICIGFLQSSTSVSRINSNATELFSILEFALQRNIEAGRATLWLWQDSIAIPHLTIVFHASDGNPAAGVAPPRFFVCAGVDSSLSFADAYSLLSGAVSQFVTNNKPITKEQIWLYTEQGSPPLSGDLIFPIFDHVTKNDCKIAAGTPENYANARFPNKIQTYQLK
jgi:hypothetical protein